jgi:hypothetical protein
MVSKNFKNDVDIFMEINGENHKHLGKIQFLLRKSNIFYKN